MHPNLEEIIKAFREHKYFVTDHAVKRMVQRHIATFRLEDAIGDDAPEIIEDEPNDSRGPCCIVLGYTKTQQPLHARIAYWTEIPLLITVYDPRTRPHIWSSDFKKKR